MSLAQRNAMTAKFLGRTYRIVFLVGNPRLVHLFVDADMSVNYKGRFVGKFDYDLLVSAMREYGVMTAKRKQMRGADIFEPIHFEEEFNLYAAATPLHPAWSPNEDVWSSDPDVAKFDAHEVRYLGIRGIQRPY